jgi:CHAT domain-containing protein/tetratricopeptide (TPR) repeat protein
MRRAALGLIVVLGLLLAPPAPAQQPAADLGALNGATMEALTAGDTALALERARAAVDAARALPDPDPVAVAYALNNLGYALSLAADPQAADLLDEALAFAEQSGLTGTDPWYLAATNRANLHVASGDIAAAEALVTRILATGRNTPSHGRAAGIAASVHFAAGQYVAAIEFLEELLAVDPEILRPVYGTIYTTYAQTQEAMEQAGRTDDAIALITGRIAILRRFMPEEVEGIQNLLSQKFFQLHQAERYGPAADALRDWAAAAPLSADELAYVDEMATLTLTATQSASYTELREVQLDYAQLAVAYAELTGIENDPRLGLALREVAHAQTNLGLHEQAAQTLRRAARVLEATEEGRKSLHLILDDLAANAWQRNDLSLSERLYEQAQGAYRVALSNGAEPLTPVDLAIGATNRARLMTDMGRPQEALDLTEIALTQYRQDTDVIPTWNIRAEMARIHAAAATALADLGQPEQALARLDLALSIARESYPENHPDLATALANAADFLFVQGNKTRALSLLEEAIAINTAALPDTMPMAVDARLKLALFHLAEGHLDTALPLLQTVADARKAPAYRSQLPDSFQNFELLAWSLLSGTDQPSPARLDEALAALQWTQVTRSAEALAMMEARLAADDPLQAVWLRRRQDLREAHTRDTSALLAAYGSGTDPSAIQALDSRLNRLETELRTVENTLSDLGLDTAGLTGVEPLHLSEIQALLDPGEVLVTFLLPGLRPDMVAGLDGSSNRTIAISHGAVRVAAIPDDSRRSLNDRITAFRCQVAVSDPNCATFTTASTRGAMLAEEDGDDPTTGFDADGAFHLYQDLFGGVSGMLTEADHLIISPPADLLRLPFQALVTDPKGGPNGTPDWLIRHNAVSVLPSITSLRGLRNQPSRKARGLGRYLGLGDPVIGNSGPVDCATVRMANLRAAPPETPDLMDGDTGAALARPAALRALPRLPDSACEVEAIGRVFGNAASLFTGSQATESRVKFLDASAQLAQYDVIVFATHGLTAGEAGARAPGLVLTPPDIATAEDDGLLTAAEIATMHLNASLVVLSACNTAAGEDASAEGLSGLARAFFHAGGSSLLVTHWSVYSSAAVEVSTGLFRTLQDEPELGHAEALRRSVLAILDDPAQDPLRTHPSYWAPFAIVGLR